MLAVVKTVYYCEHCKRHRMTAASIEKHEPRCIYNPERTVCGWHKDHPPFANAGLLAAELRETYDVADLRKKVDGCPACMLAAVVQARVPYREELDFDYATEVERFRKEEQYADVW